MTPEAVFKNLISIYRENKLAHAYLFETNNIYKTLDDLKKFIKFISCQKEYTDNCTKCNICNLIDTNSLPSVILITPDNNTIKKEKIEFIKQSFSTKPIYTKFNIYIVLEPELMNETAYNRMLKFIEEPEEDIIGFFITQNKGKIADTILSRLELIKIYYNDYSENNSEIPGNIKSLVDQIVPDYIKKINLGIDELIWYNTSVIQANLTEKIQIIYFFQTLLKEFQDKVKNDFNEKNIGICKLIIKYSEMLNYNVNISLLLDSFAIEMEQIYGK